MASSSGHNPALLGGIVSLLVTAACDAPRPEPASIASIALDSPVHEMHLAPDENHVWVWMGDAGLKSISLRDHAIVDHLGDAGRLRAVGALPDGEPIIATALPSKKIVLRRSSGETIATLPNAENLVFSPDGLHVIVEIGHSRFARRRITDLRDKFEFRVGKQTNLPPVRLFAAHPENTTLAVADEGGFVQIVDWMTGELVHPRKRMVAGPWTYAMNRSVTRVAAGTGPTLHNGARLEFNGIRVWDFEQQGEVQAWRIPHDEGILALAFLDGGHLVSSNLQSGVQMWTVGEDHPREIYRHSVRVTSLLAVPGGLILQDEDGMLFDLSIPDI